jgi:peroxiredoxin
MKFIRLGLGVPILALQVLALTALPGPADIKWLPPQERPFADLSLELKTLEGKSVSLADMRNSVVLVTFWATWCKPCKEEMPQISALYDTLHKEGLEMVAVTNESARTVRSYLKNKDFRFPILLDQKEKLFDRFKIDRFPTTLVIDQSGKLALRHVGPTDWNSPSIISTLHSLISQNADQ